MRTIEELKAEALDATTLRGHVMKPWTDHSPHLAETTCTQCEAFVQVNTKPMPNEIDIGGPAIAVGCPESVSPTHGWILWEVAKARLTDAGYHVEKSYGTLYVRATPNSSPDRLSINAGKCSPRSVDRLLKKLALKTERDQSSS
jgi:hypothetical protein